MTAGRRVHFYSDQTRVSLELPVGWVEAEKGERSASYVSREPGAEGASLAVTVTRVRDDEGGSHERLLAALLGRPGGAVEERAERTVDGLPAVEAVVARDTEGARFVEAHVAAQTSDLVWAFSVMAPYDDRDRTLAVFRDAVDSVRLILS